MTKTEILQRYDEAVASFAAGLAAGSGLLDNQMEKEYREQYGLFKAGRDAIRAELVPNEPLTLEELRRMDGEPVWVEFIGRPDGSLIPPLWMLVNVGMRQLVTDVEYVDWSDEGWTAYRRKPDGGGDHA